MAQNYKLYRIIDLAVIVNMHELKQPGMNELYNTILESRHTIIIPHKNPDGDAIGSALGLSHYLTEKGKSNTILVNDAAPAFLDYLPGFNSILNFETHREDCLAEIAKADLIICNDYSQISRCGNLSEWVMKSKAKKAVIDHHPEPESHFDFSLHIVEASSTSELIYMLISKSEPGYSISKNVATCLYTGLLTDTGCFKHALRPETFMAAAELLKSGISYEYIVSKIFDSNTPERIALIGFALNEKLVILDDYRTAYISISFEESEKLGLKKGDTEGLVNYTLSINNMVMGAFFHEREKGKTKVSLRSKGKFAVNLISQNNFNGGGHKNAAGGDYAGTADETAAKFKSILPQYKAELSSLTIGDRD